MLDAPITANDPRGELIREAAIIIWDEAPMANRAVLASVEETCRRVMGNSLPFSGKVVVLLGDFCQTCPVIRGGTRAQVVDASIKSSELWKFFTIYRLTIPVRNAEDLEFANFIDAIGDGAGFKIHLDMLDKSPDHNDLADFVYPTAALQDPVSCLKHAILAPTNLQVNAYNERILARVEGTERTYMAALILEEVEESGMIPPDSILDYAARHPPPGFPLHCLKIKTNAVFRLIRNLSLDRGLVKNVRVVVIDVGRRVVTVRILRGVGGFLSLMLRTSSYHVFTSKPPCPLVILCAGHSSL